MKISTQDCKNFLSNIAHILGESPKENWKRVKKYKQLDLTLRIFENSQGRKLTIAEKNNQLFLYSLMENVVCSSVSQSDTISSKGYQKFHSSIKKSDVFEFIADCCKKDSKILSFYGEEDSTIEDTLQDAIIPNNWFMIDDIEEFELDEIPIDLFYSEEKKLDPQNISKVYWVALSDYDTAYRIYIYETKDHELFLGCNEPD
jgi:hypothetical protein